MRGKEFGKRILAGMTAVCLGLTGIPAAAQEADGTAVGRYLETELSLPGEVTDNGEAILDLARLEDGSLRMVTYDWDKVEPVSLWDSLDGGESWEQAAALPRQYSQLYFMDIKLAPDGSGAGIAMIQGDWNSEEGAGSREDALEESGGNEDYNYYYVSFDAEGKAQATQQPESIGGLLQITKDGQVLGMAYNGDVWLLERDTGEALQQLASSASMVGVCGQEGLILSRDGELLRYDLNSGEPLERDEAMNEALFSNGEDYSDISSQGHKINFAEDEEGRLYYCTRKGIFSHVMRGSAVEQVVDGSLNALSDSSIGIVALEAAEGSFYVVYSGEASGIRKYAFDPAVSSVPEREVTVYSLWEDNGIRQAAVQFQKMYPDTYINYEVGISGEEGVTVSDALRTLNTDILAGNGPDILFMDGMSVDTYAGRGMLTDLSEMLAEVSGREGLFENIAYTYREGETVCAVPARFGIAAAAGDTSVLNRLENLDSLAELAAEEKTIGWGEMIGLPLGLYYSCAGSWEREDGSIDQEKLSEYVTGIKRIYDNWITSATGEEQEYFREGIDYLPQMNGTEYYGIGGGALSILSGDRKLEVGLLMSLIDYAAYTSLNLEENKSNTACSVRLFGGQQQNVFVPLSNLGILSTAREPERAMDFVKYLLSAEGQTTVNGRGFPVNRTAFRNMWEEDSWSGEYTASASTSDGSSFAEMTYYMPTKEEQQWLTNAAETVNIRGDNGSVLQEAVLTDMARCLKGEIGAEEVVNSIMQKMNLYLAENQ